MSNPHTIIDLVKELRKEHKVSQYLTERREAASESLRFDFTDADAEHIAKLHNRFPSIAQALLDATATLQRIEDDVCSENECGCCDNAYLEANQALKRIRSLSA